jgi:hypothetical protein
MGALVLALFFAVAVSVFSGADKLVNLPRGMKLRASNVKRTVPANEGQA